jgi:aryl-alcohol dehydrogenase-like predicted oxidoreductase
LLLSTGGTMATVDLCRSHCIDHFERVCRRTRSLPRHRLTCDLTVFACILLQAAQHLTKLRDEGSLHQVGACNFDLPHLKAMVDAGVPIVSNQVQYSLLDRRPENGMLAYAKEKGIRLGKGKLAVSHAFSCTLAHMPSQPRSSNTASCAKAQRQARGVQVLMLHRQLPSAQWPAGSCRIAGSALVNPPERISRP